MSFRTLGFLLLIISQVSFAQGRGPAVEDFVGIEVDHPEGTPQGTEGLFNFEQEMNKFDTNKKNNVIVVKSVPIPKADGPNGITTAIAIALILGLPGVIWFFMMNNLRQKAHIESASNIEVLEKYRREKQEAKKMKEELKKVS
jgi:hypothetical protein